LQLLAAATASAVLQQNAFQELQATLGDLKIRHLPKGGPNHHAVA